MLGRNHIFTIKYLDKEIDLEFKLLALKNIWDMVGYSPFEFLSDFLTKETDRDIKIAQLLFCITNGKLDIVDVLQNLLIDKDTIDIIYEGLRALIELESKSEIANEEESDNANNSIELTREDKIKNWEYWWNNMYYNAKINFKMTYDEMLNTTVRELKTLDKMNTDYQKNILLDTYITVMKAQGKVTDNKKTTTKNVRIKDFLMR